MLGTHGLRGEVRVRALSGAASALFDATRVQLVQGSTSPVEYRVERTSLHRGQVLMKLQGLDRIELVEPLLGSRVLMRFADLAQLPDDEFYWFELEGMRVVDRQLGVIGRIEELLVTPAHDVYVVRGEHGEVLIPAVDEFVVDVDRQQRCMTVDLPEGLVPEADDL